MVTLGTQSMNFNMLSTLLVQNNHITAGLKATFTVTFCPIERKLTVKSEACTSGRHCRLSCRWNVTSRVCEVPRKQPVVVEMCIVDFWSEVSEFDITELTISRSRKKDNFIVYSIYTNMKCKR